MKKITLAILFIAVFVLGYFSRLAQDSAIARNDKARQQEAAAQAVTQAVDMARAQKDYENLLAYGNEWPRQFNTGFVRLMGPQLSASLANRWSETAFMDSAWGVAYWATNRLEPGKYESLSYQEAMSDQKQDEMIRFLCFMIELARVRQGDWVGSALFKNLQTYPRVSRPEHARMLDRAVMKAISSQDSSLWRGACHFLTCQLPQQWAQSRCWYTLDYGGRWNWGIPSDHLPVLLRDIRFQTWGKFPEEFPGRHDDPEIMAAAAAMLAKFCDTDWSKVPAVRPDTIEQWKQVKDWQRRQTSTTTAVAN